jgi:radical SAM superfamily enzyme YgiQ (UPF0313 family)
MRHIIFLNGIWPNSHLAIPKQYTRSIGPYQLKHWLSHFGFSCQVIDYCQLLTHKEIVEYVSKFLSADTIAIGVSTTFWPTSVKIPNNIKVAIEHIKSEWPNIKIISGGARTVDMPTLFDKHFSGESENGLVAWCQSHVKKSSLLNKKFDITKNSHRFDYRDAIMPSEALPIELGRGCIFKCKFCSHHNLGKPKFTYQRQFEYILDEIEYNKKCFNTDKYMLLDDTVNEDLDKLRNLANTKKSLGFDIEWTGYLRADLVWAKPESVDLLAQSGLRSCFFGIETFNKTAGKSIDKGWASKHGKEYIPKLYTELWNKKINIHLNFIAGLPGESLITLQDSLEWCKIHDIGYHRFVPLTLYVEKQDKFASSEFTRNYKDHGYTNVNETTGYWESTEMTLPEATLFCKNSERSLTTVNRVSSWDVFSMSNLGFTTDEVMQWNSTKYMWAIFSNRLKFKNLYLEQLSNIPD